MNNFNEIINQAKPTLVDFFATWCGPCKMQSPIIEQLKEKVGDTANVLKIDVDQNRQVAEKYRIQSIPTLILFKNGEPLWRVSGLQSLDALESKIKEHL